MIDWESKVRSWQSHYLRSQRAFLTKSLPPLSKVSEVIEKNALVRPGPFTLDWHLASLFPPPLNWGGVGGGWGTILFGCREGTDLHLFRIMFRQWCCGRIAGPPSEVTQVVEQIINPTSPPDYKITIKLQYFHDKMTIKSSQKHPKIIPTSFQNHPKIILKSSQNHTKIIPKSS